MSETGPAADKRDAADLSHAELALFAHELRGALTVIAGYTALLRHPLIESERQAALAGIERAIVRADSLCSDALAGRTPAPLPNRLDSYVDLRVLAEEVAADQRSATQRDIAVSGASDLPVRGDAFALARVLGNLVGNAAKYSPVSTQIDIALAREESPGGPDIAVVEVADRGPGVPAAMRDRVFEPFERLERDSAAPGVGLGLAIVHDVIGAHGGSARILDRDGGGTVVRLELPAADES